MPLIAAHGGRRGRGRPVHAGHAPAQGGQDLVGGVAGAVDPVVQDDSPLLIIRRWLGRVLHDQRSVQAPVELHAGVRVVPVGSGIGRGEPVGEGSAGRDGCLGHCGHAVHVVAEGDAVPVHGGLGRQLVAQCGLNDVLFADPDLRPGHLPVIAPGVHDHAAEVYRASRRGQGDGHNAAGLVAGGLGRGDLRAVRPDRVRSSRSRAGLGGRRRGGASGGGAQDPQGGRGEPGTEEGAAVGVGHGQCHLRKRAPHGSWRA